MESVENQVQKAVLMREVDAPQVYEALHACKRTGWVENGVENPESVKEHTEALLRLAYELQPQLTEAEFDGLLDMLEVHDWPEAVVGDEVILELRPDERKTLKEIKFEKEKAALEELCKQIPGGTEIVDLWLRFEKSDDPAAMFGRELDKYQAVEKALEYEESQKIQLFEEFLTYSTNFIQHPVLRARLEKLKERWSAHK